MNQIPILPFFAVHEFYIYILQDTFEELLIPKIDVDSTRKPHIVRYILNKKLKPVVEARQSIFERVYPINEKLALKMLAGGYRQPSRFGRWCPVKVIN